MNAEMTKSEWRISVTESTRDELAALSTGGGAECISDDLYAMVEYRQLLASFDTEKEIGRN